MARGHPLGPDAVGILQQLAELQPGVADDARIGRAAGGVFGDEIVDDPAEFLLEIQHVKGYAQPVGHAAGIGRIGRAAAALFTAGRCSGAAAGSGLPGHAA